MGITASIGLTMFLFNIGWEFSQGIANDVGIVREDVAYIKGVIETWSETYVSP